MQRMRVLVLFEPGRGGQAALAVARGLVEDEGASLTLAAVAPRAPSGSRCGNSAFEYNVAVRDSVAADLARARALLDRSGEDAACEMLDESERLEQFVSAHGFDVVVLPSRRDLFRRTRHPAAGRLRRSTNARVQVANRRP
jgi:hypothetical protein